VKVTGAAHSELGWRPLDVDHIGEVPWRFQMEWATRVARSFGAVFDMIFTRAATVSSDWGRVTVDAQPLLGNRRQQVADVANGGSRRFALAYITSSETAASPLDDDSVALHDAPPPEDFEELGPLKLAHFDVGSGLRSPPLTIAGVDAGWVRAATGGPTRRRNCPLVVSFFGADLDLRLRVGLEFTTFFAYGGVIDQTTREAGLLRVRWCNGRAEMKRVPLAFDGSRPSIAIGRRADETKLLFVYGEQNRILGRFVDVDGESTGPPFILATFPEEQSVRSTDAIWNTVGDHFIVGYMQHESGVDSVSVDHCAVRNIRVNWDGSIDEPLLHGACDPQRGGHHTSVDCDNRAHANPDGVYAWWYQGIDGPKGIRMMDAGGEPIGTPVNLAQGAWTQPVTARREEKRPWPFNLVFGRPSGSYNVAARESPGSGPEQRMSAWTFDTDGDLRKFGLLETTLHKSDPVAIEALENESVSVWRTATDDGRSGPWGVTVFPHSTERVVAVEP